MKIQCPDNRFSPERRQVIEGATAIVTAGIAMPVVLMESGTAGASSNKNAPSSVGSRPTRRDTFVSDVTEITQLVLRERQGRDRGWWTQMAECFHPDSLVFLSWFRGSGAEFVARSQAMSASGIRAVHRLSPPVVHLSGRRAVVELPSAIEIRSMLNGVEADAISYTRLLYQVEQHEMHWKILTLNCIYERDTLTPSVPGTILSFDLKRLREFRVPYRFIGYQLSQSGFPVADDLYGDDQPDRVNALYAAAFEWMRQTTP